MTTAKPALVILLGALQWSAPSMAAPNLHAMGTPTSQPSLRPGGSVLTPSGYGSIKIGSKPGDIRGYTIIDKYGQNDQCYVASVKEAPDLALLIINGIIKRISIGENSPSRVKTDRGINIGSTQASVVKAYRSTSVRAHQYIEKPGADLTWLVPGTLSGVRFETGVDRKVKVIHVGLLPELSYVERCG